MNVLPIFFQSINEGFIRSNGTAGPLRMTVIFQRLRKCFSGENLLPGWFAVKFWSYLQIYVYIKKQRRTSEGERLCCLLTSFHEALEALNQTPSHVRPKRWGTSMQRKRKIDEDGLCIGDGQLSFDNPFVHKGPKLDEFSTKRFLETYCEANDIILDD